MRVAVRKFPWNAICLAAGEVEDTVESRPEIDNRTLWIKDRRKIGFVAVDATLERLRKVIGPDEPVETQATLVEVWCVRIIEDCIDRVTKRWHWCHRGERPKLDKLAQPA